MRSFLAIVVVLLAAIAGLYVGVWLLLVGGIVEIIEAAKMEPVSSFGIAWGIVKIIFASPVGWLTFWVGILFAKMIGD